MLVQRGEISFLATAVAVVAVLSTGCSSTTTSVDRNIQSETATSARSDSSFPALPIEFYMFTAAQTNFLDKVFTGVTRQCMSRFGLSYDDPSPPAVDIRLLDRRYGITDARSAATHGYHLAPDSPQAVAQAQAAQHRPPRRDPDYTRVLTGLSPGDGVVMPSNQQAGSYHGVPIPVGGCFSEARSALDENGPGSDFSVVHEINIQSFDQSTRVPSVRDTVAQWSHCMSAAGYSYDGPLAVLVAFDLNAATPSQQELRTAQADVDCKLRTNLVAIWTTVEVTIQNASIRANNAALTLIRDRMDRQLRAADAITKGHGK